ncbi:hypothetical protein [Ruminococcus sp. Marseille-P6503]|uniref:hypothetical protein n=1 Tax=Ruminococcus sp. Marseille-P6503 TaxID=2364796 RepID=UPI000F5228EA|nr:hypothetical protein [Ruminococcus sp. Marseille-P6503]
MTNYMGKNRLKKILMNYLKLTDEDKLHKLQYEIKNSKKEHGFDFLYYKRHKGSEWLEVTICFNDTTYEFQIFSDVNLKQGNRRVELQEKRVREIDFEKVEKVIFRGSAFYSENFEPNKQSGSYELMCDEIGFKSSTELKNALI